MPGLSLGAIQGVEQFHDGAHEDYFKQLELTGQWGPKASVITPHKPPFSRHHPFKPAERSHPIDRVRARQHWIASKPQRDSWRKFFENGEPRLEVTMKADLQALAKLLLPLSNAEREGLSALQWLERKTNLPTSIETYFWETWERAADTVLPETERRALRGCTDVSRYRAAFDEHFARRRALQERGNGTS